MAAMAGERAEGEADAGCVVGRLRRAATIASASSTVGASGFSHSTCLPAASSASTTSRCRWLATTTLTTSMSSASTIACQDVSGRS